jgi:hypothetical protein
MFLAKVGLADLTKAREHVERDDNRSIMVKASSKVKRI